MSIPESKLLTWAKQGAIDASKRTYHSVKKALDEHDWLTFKNRSLNVDVAARHKRVAKVNPPLRSRIKRLEAEFTAKMKLLNDKLMNGSVSKEEWKKESEKLKKDFDEKLKELRKEYRRIDILVKREAVR